MFAECQACHGRRYLVQGTRLGELPETVWCGNCRGHGVLLTDEGVGMVRLIEMVIRGELGTDQYTANGGWQRDHKLAAE